MRFVLLIASVACSIACAVTMFGVHPTTHAQAPSQVESLQADALMRDAIAAAGSIHPGATRAEVERNFIPDGGAQNGQVTRYMWRKSHLIRIDVTFTAAPETRSLAGLLPTDEVVGVSKPYLEIPGKK
ncbi:MAG TPA: hypothetical protein VG844_11135 [Terracidiphilus sp.]|nr:hypothetical protein [Terracidiphilus sp.]